jgi:hypothetical protein
MNAVMHHGHNTMCPVCRTGKLIPSERGDTYCHACGDKLIQEGSCWYDGRGVVRVFASFLDRHAIPYCAVQHRRGAPRLVSQGQMLRQWEFKPDHVDNGRAG